MMLEYAGVTYECLDKGDQSADKPGIFAVPAVKFPDGLVMSQTAAVIITLGKMLGLMPSTEFGEARALQVAMNASDMAQEFSKLKTDDQRCSKWLDVMESVLAEYESAFMVGGSLTYADFAAYLPLKNLSNGGKVGAHPKIVAWLEMMDGIPELQRIKNSGIPILPASMA